MNIFISVSHSSHDTLVKNTVLPISVCPEHFWNKKKAKSFKSQETSGLPHELWIGNNSAGLTSQVTSFLIAIRGNAWPTIIKAKPWTASQSAFQEVNDPSGSIPSAFAGVGKGEEESALGISCCLALFCYFPHQTRRLIMWKVEFDCISKMQRVMILHNAGYFQRSSPTATRRPLGKHVNLLSQAHIQKYLTKPIFWPFGFSITAGTQPARVWPLIVL